MSKSLSGPRMCARQRARSSCTIKRTDAPAKQLIVTRLRAAGRKGREGWARCQSEPLSMVGTPAAITPEAGNGRTVPPDRLPSMAPRPTFSADQWWINTFTTYPRQQLLSTSVPPHGDDRCCSRWLMPPMLADATGLPEQRVLLTSGGVNRGVKVEIKELRTTWAQRPYRRMVSLGDVCPTRTNLNVLLQFQ